ncbi:MAG TPA: GNAT family N-acetyltransferase [Halomicronema sp.]
MTNFTYGPVSDFQEAENLGEILCQCFLFGGHLWPLYRDRLGVENFRILKQNDQVVAGLTLYQMGQYFGGDSVQMAGVAAVGVSPEVRGSGAGFELISQTLKELYSQQIPLSTLYPATQRLYRKAGYEQAGSRCLWEVPIDSIRLHDRSLEVRKVKKLEAQVFQDIYNKSAKENEGNLDRNKAIWENVFDHNEDEVYGYLVGSENPEGYIIFSQKTVNSQNLMEIWDWAATTPAARRRLLTFISDHRSQIQKVIWRGSLIDPFLLFLPEQTAKVGQLEIWFLRIVDVISALEKRGYPENLETELHLKISDDILPENNGNFVLSVSGKKGQVTKGGKGDLKLQISALAPLYSGFYTPYQLQQADHIEASKESLSIASQIFAGSPAWMPDFF